MRAEDVPDRVDPKKAETLVEPGRYGTPTGAPCPRTVRVDGGVDGSGECLGCGACLLGTGLV